MSLTNFKKEEIFGGKSELLCGVDGCSRIWAVRFDGQLPKCSRHQWQQPMFGNTKTYQRYLADKGSPGVAKTVETWYTKDKW